MSFENDGFKKFIETEIADDETKRYENTDNFFTIFPSNTFIMYGIPNFQLGFYTFIIVKKIDCFNINIFLFK